MRPETWDAARTHLPDRRAGRENAMSGPSGCGKSTLARCLTGLIPHLYRGALQGEVRLAGRLTTETPLWELAELAGLVLQNPAGQMLAHSVEVEILFGLENLGLARDEMQRRLEQSLAALTWSRSRHRPPQTLSGGEQQKLALAAITARRPPLLVLDEPLSMLDGTAAAELIDHLAALAEQGTAVLVCEHRAEYLQHLPELRRLELNGYAAPVAGPPSASKSELPIPSVQPFELTVQDLSVQLGGRDVLRNLSFQARGGQVVAIVGRNGAGKTTLLRPGRPAKASRPRRRQRRPAGAGHGFSESRLAAL